MNKKKLLLLTSALLAGNAKLQAAQPLKNFTSKKLGRDPIQLNVNPITFETIAQYGYTNNGVINVTSGIGLDSGGTHRVSGNDVINGDVTNDNTIKVNGNNSMGMGVNNNYKAYNNNIIEVIGTGSTAMGVGTSVNNQPTGDAYIENDGTIKLSTSSTGSTAINATKNTSVKNFGAIRIDSSNSTGVSLGDSSTFANEEGSNLNIYNNNVTGVLAKDSSRATNNGSITIYDDIALTSGAAMKSTGGTLVNNTNGSITLQSENVIGMDIEGGRGENSGKIFVNNSKSIGINLDSGTAENMSGGNIFVSNEGIGMNITGNGPLEIINSGKITTFGNAIGMNVGVDNSVTVGPIVTNKGTVELDGNQAGGVGINVNGKGVGQNLGNIDVYSSQGVGVKSIGGTFTNKSTGVINVDGSNSFGTNISNSGVANNEGTVNVTGTNGVGMFSDTNGKVENVLGGTINVGSSNGKGLFAGATGNGKNSGTVNVNNSTGIGIKTSGGTLENSQTGVINLNNGGVGVKALYGTGSNKGTINNKSVNSIGMLSVNGTVVNEGTGVIIMSSQNAIGMQVDDFGIGNNKGIINVNGVSSIGMNTNAGVAVNDTGTINVNSNQGIGMSATDGSIENKSTINLSNNSNIAMRAISSQGVGTNSGIINISSITKTPSVNSIGMLAADGGKVVNSGTINLIGQEYSVGMETDANLTSRAENSGVIHMDSNASYGMESHGGLVINKASGEIIVDGENSSGIYANGTGKGQNDGDIDINGINGIGVHAKNGGYITMSDNSAILIDHESGMAGLSDGTNSRVFADGTTTSLKDGIVAFKSINGGYTKIDGIVNLTGDNSTAGVATSNGTVENIGSIILGKDNSIGLKATSSGTVINRGEIIFSGVGNLTGNITSLQAIDGGRAYNYGTLNDTGDNKNSVAMEIINGSTGGNFGAINLTGESSTGISIHTGGVIENIGTIAISNKNSTGVMVGKRDGVDDLVTASGLNSTNYSYIKLDRDATGSIGIDLNNPLLGKFAGNIDVMSDDSYGIRVTRGITDGNINSNSLYYSGVINVSGNNSVGISMDDGASNLVLENATVNGLITGDKIDLTLPDAFNSKLNSGLDLIDYIGSGEDSLFVSGNVNVGYNSLHNFEKLVSLKNTTLTGETNLDVSDLSDFTVPTFLNSSNYTGNTYKWNDSSAVTGNLVVNGKVNIDVDYENLESTGTNKTGKILANSISLGNTGKITLQKNQDNILSTAGNIVDDYIKKFGNDTFEINSVAITNAAGPVSKNLFSLVESETGLNGKSDYITYTEARLNELTGRTEISQVYEYIGSEDPTPPPPPPPPPGPDPDDTPPPGPGPIPAPKPTTPKFITLPENAMNKVLADDLQLLARNNFDFFGNVAASPESERSYKITDESEYGRDYSYELIGGHTDFESIHNYNFDYDARKVGIVGSTAFFYNKEEMGIGYAALLGTEIKYGKLRNFYATDAGHKEDLTTFAMGYSHKKKIDFFDITAGGNMGYSFHDIDTYFPGEGFVKGSSKSLVTQIFGEVGTTKKLDSKTTVLPFANMTYTFVSGEDISYKNGTNYEDSRAGGVDLKLGAKVLHNINERYSVGLSLGGVYGAYETLHKSRKLTGWNEYTAGVHQGKLSADLGIMLNAKVKDDMEVSAEYIGKYSKNVIQNNIKLGVKFKFDSIFY